MKLQDKVSEIRGVGEKKSALLHNMRIDTVDDLLHLVPRRYEDRRQTLYIMEAPFDKDVLVQGRVVRKQIKGKPYNKKAPLSILVEDSSASLEVLFFNGRYLSSYFQPETEYTFYGKITLNNGRRQMIHPEFHRSGDKDDLRGIFPVYPLTEGITQQYMRKIQLSAREAALEYREWIPGNIVAENGLCDPVYALRNIHFPENERQIGEARFRMVFEELFVLETGLSYIKQGNIVKKEGIALKKDNSEEEFTARLSFELTEGQKRVWREIEKDLMALKPMNRLVQGDVGCGKTAVAEMAMYKTVKNGFQAVMMAPTELLAKQHFASLTRDMEPLGVRTGLLCSSLKAKERRKLIEELREGRIDVLVGTHAIIQPDVIFKSLGLVITDEQHRFGVEQRNLLTEKGVNPNVLVMTATPIPRTLAVILYGDLDISVIDSMPPGRKPVKTYVRSEKSRKEIYNFVAEEIKKGRQAYVVAPLIEESEAIDCHSAQELYDELRRAYRNINLGLVHGAMKQEEKDKVMEDFASGEIDILVSTVVIEVGIDVSNATVMVIENCERFGLAQMHQLRGRVGRGREQSYCVLICGHESVVARKRNEIMCKSEDGFEIAEEDLKLRGPGEIFGTRQHGLPELRISDLARHVDILEKAKKAAGYVIKGDPELIKSENAQLKIKVKKLFGDNIQLNL